MRLPPPPPNATALPRSATPDGEDSSAMQSRMARGSSSSSSVPCPATSFAAAGAPSLGNLSVKNRLPSAPAKLK
ncbi:hypothetical protein ACHAWF_000110 [Thalassiosira exigua]